MKKYIENLHALVHHLKKQFKDRHSKGVMEVFPYMLGLEYTIFEFLLHLGHDGVDETPVKADYIPFSYRFEKPLVFEVHDWKKGPIHYKTIQVRAVGLRKHPDEIFRLIQEKDKDTLDILYWNLVIRLANEKNWNLFKYYSLSEDDFIKALRLEKYITPFKITNK